MIASSGPTITAIQAARAMASGGAVMALKARQGGQYVDRPGKHQGVLEPGSPAEIRVAEKQIPDLAIKLHGGTFVLLVVGTLLVALGV